MEPNKIETQIKEKLDAREIQPSAQAWDRLDAMLSVAEEKKTRRPLGWLYIAAGILVFVTLGLFFFTQNSTTVKPEINVVNTDIKKDTIQNAVNAVQTSITTPQQENQVTVSESQSKSINHE